MIFNHNSSILSNYNNVDTCKLMHLGYSRGLGEYVVNGAKLESITEEKDMILRLIISDSVKWVTRCSEAVKKAKLGMIKRNFADRYKEMMILLYRKSGQTSCRMMLSCVELSLEQ